MDKRVQQVIVALDVDSREEALALARKLKDSGCALKVGLELYATAGLEMVSRLKELEFRVFLDLKLHDIPTTVARTMRVLTRSGADWIDVHCSGGYEMMRQAVLAAREEGEKTGYKPQVIGVTVLTSMDECQLRQELGVGRTIDQQVLAFAELAKEAGLQGVVASPREVAMLRRTLGDDFTLITPGIRPKWSAANDQVRVLTPSEAIASGSSLIVIGRPVTRAEDPLEALNRLWD